MKRLLFLTVFVFASWCVYGQGQEMCNRAFNHAVNLYNTGRYKEAKMQFEWCGDHCGSSYTGWLEKCNLAIDQQEQAARRRRQAEIEAIRRKEAEAIARAQRIKDNQFIFLSSSSPVLGNFSHIESEIQGKIRQVNPSLRFINDSSEAYYAARIVVNIDQRPGAQGDIRNYDVCAAVEIEDLTTGEFLGRFLIKEGDGCSTNIPEESAEVFVANKIYSRKDFFNCIAEGISNVISNKPFNPVDCYVRDQNIESASRKKTVVLIYGNVNKEAANAIRSSMINALINDDQHRFMVLNHNAEAGSLIQTEIAYGEGHVSTSEMARVGNQKGAEWVCGVFISGSEGNALFFECQVINVESTEVIMQAQYSGCAFSGNKPITYFNIASAKHVAKHLADDLGLLTGTQHDELNKEDHDFQSKIGKERTTSTLCAFVPGLAQLNREQKGQKIKGGLIIASEALTIGGIALSQSMRNINIKKMNSTNNASLKKMYADKANTYTTVRNISIGAAAAVYVWNVLDAFLYKEKNKDGSFLLNPVITDECVAISLSINF